jgi:hypothetical protein
MSSLARTSLAAAVVVASLTNSSAQAMSPGSVDYVASRVGAAFDAAAAMPPVEPVRVPMAKKGDLPIPLTCFGAQADAAAAECMNLDFAVPAQPSIVVETRFGNTSILMRMDAATIADFVDEGQNLQFE